MRCKVMVWVVGLVAASISGDASATPLSELAAALQPGEWAELQTADLLPAVAEPNGGAAGSIFLYAESAVWDQSTGQVIFIGGDHIYEAQDSGPRMIRYGDQTNAWTAQAIPWASNGTMHGYDHSAMYEDRLYQMSLVVDQPIYRYDPSTDAWDEVATLPYTGYNRFGGLEPFPEAGGLVYVEATSIYAYDAAADEWSVVATDVPMGDYHNFAEYSPPHGVVLLGGGNGSGALHTMDADFAVTERDSAPFPLLVNEAIVTHDPNSGDFLVFGGDSEFLVYDPVDDILLVQDSEVPFFDSPAYPVENTVAAVIECYGVVMFVEHDGIALDGSASVWVYRHAPGRGTPPDPPGPPDPPAPTGGDEGDEGDTAGGDDPDPDGDSSSGSNGEGHGTGPGSDAGADEGAGNAGDDGTGGDGTGGDANTPGAGSGSGGCTVGAGGSGSSPAPLAPLLLGLMAIARRRRRGRRAAVGW